MTLGGKTHALADDDGRRARGPVQGGRGRRPSAIAHAVAILNTALAEPIGDATPARLDELSEAVRAVYRHAGFAEIKPGEGEAPATATGAYDFDHVYGHLASNCGMSPDQIRATLWSDYLRLCRYWADHPPLRDMVQAFLKIKPQARSRNRLALERRGPDLDHGRSSAFPGGRL